MKLVQGSLALHVLRSISGLAKMRRLQFDLLAAVLAVGLDGLPPIHSEWLRGGEEASSSMHFGQAGLIDRLT